MFSVDHNRHIHLKDLQKKTHANVGNRHKNKSSKQTMNNAVRMLIEWDLVWFEGKLHVKWIFAGLDQCFREHRTIHRRTETPNSQKRVTDRHLNKLWEHKLNPLNIFKWNSGSMIGSENGSGQYNETWWETMRQQLIVEYASRNRVWGLKLSSALRMQWINTTICQTRIGDSCKLHQHATERRRQWEPYLKDGL